MRINFNASAVIANNALNRNDNRLQDSLARLSSGLKVVNAKDNPSGLAMSKKMNAQIKGLDQAGDNAGDGVGNAHQRRMKRRRDAPDDEIADETGQGENG